MITRLQVRNFKSLRELDVEFGRLTVIVGPNGCGKSSVLQAIELVRDVLMADHGRQIGPDFPAGAVSSQVAASGQVEPASINFTQGLPTSGCLDAKLSPLAEYPHVLDTGSSSVTYTADGSSFEQKNWKPREVPSWVQRRLAPINLYQFDKGIMERSAYSDEPYPTLGRRGEDLAAVLDAMQGERREEFEAIEKGLCKFITGLERIRLHRVKMPIARTVLDGNSFRQIQDHGVGHQVVFDFRFAQGITANLASEGTILLLGLLTVIGAKPGPPTTIMLDDLDRGLHPKAQKQLIAHLRELLAQRPELQIIATTHSPYLVEHLEYEEVLAMTQSEEDGRSLIAPLAEHPDAERWREEMSAGEFWSSVGEDWLRKKAQ